MPIVVGYAPANLQNLGLTAGSCFKPVSAQKVDLIDMKGVGYDGEAGGEIQIQTLNEYGQTQATYFWYDIPSEDILGWFDLSEEPLNRGDVEIQAGEGLWVYCAADGLGLQSSGEVPQSKVIVELQESGLSVANPTPVTVDLIDCCVSGYEEGAGGEVQVQTLNEYGQTQATYFWYDIPDEDILGWFDLSEEPLNRGDVTMAPGAGLWTYCSADGFNFEFPGVDVK